MLTSGFLSRFVPRAISTRVPTRFCSSNGNLLGRFLQRATPVKYNKRVIFPPVSSISHNDREHYQTSPLFEELAKTNKMTVWEAAGIPPLICARDSSTGHFHPLWGEGCTRANSARKVEESTRVTTRLPVLLVPDSLIIKKWSPFKGALRVQVNCKVYTYWIDRKCDKELIIPRPRIPWDNTSADTSSDFYFPGL